MTFVVAGVDSNGTNYNRGAWVVPGGGGGLVRQPDGSLRTASLRNGIVTVGAHNSYSRPHTAATFRPPFEVSGEIFLHGRMDGPFRTFGENLLVQSTDRWTWGVNFQPVFVDEDNNIVTGFSPLTKGFTSSGQIDGKYGIPRVERFTASIDHDAQFGAWHRWRMVVPAVGVHEVYWDDRLVYRVVEADPPAAWWSKPLRAGLRLDFYDYSLRNLSPEGEMSIPGVHTYHPRISWQDPKWPVIGPKDNPLDNDTAVIHYTGADDLIDGDPGEYASMLPQYLRNIQYSYAKPKALGGRGYSVGYSFAVDWLGGVWQMRGWEYQSAANLGHNDHTIPILMLVDGDDGATQEALAAARAIIREAGFRAGNRRLKVSGHGQLRIDTGVGTATSCPGAGLLRQIRAGQFDPWAIPPPTVVPPVVSPPVLEDEDIMVALIIAPPTNEDVGPNPPWMVQINGSTTYIGSAAAAQLRAAGVPVVEHNKDQYTHYRKAAGL